MAESSLPGLPSRTLGLVLLFPFGALLAGGLLGFPQLLAQTLDFGIGFLQFGLFLPQLLAQNFEFVFELLDSLEGAVRACHSTLR